MPDPTAGPSNAGMLCPVCRVDLVMADRQGVEIDYCPRCRGVWLDRGELDKIIERNAAYETPAAPQAPPPAPARQPDRGYPDHGHRGEYRDDDRRHGKPHKRKSLLGEIFDF